MAQSLAPVLQGAVVAADAIYALWSDRIRGLYLDPSLTRRSAARIHQRQASSKIAIRERAEIIKPKARAELARLEEQITLALGLAAPQSISRADLKSRLSDLLDRGEDLVDNLAEDGPYASRFREARDRVEFLAASLALAEEDQEDDDGDRGDIVEECGPPQPVPLIAAARDRQDEKLAERQHRLSSDERPEQ